MEKLVKCIWQFHDKKDDLKSIFDYSRFVSNETVRISVEKDLTSLRDIYPETYHQYREKFCAKYTINAIRYAMPKLKLYRKLKREKPHARRPYFWKDVISVDPQDYNIKDGFIEFSIKPKERMRIQLASYVLEQLEGMNVGTISITPEKLIVSYSKEVLIKEPKDWLGIDRNLNNITTCDSKGKIRIFDLSEINTIREIYRDVKSNFKRNDVRIRKKIFQKYGRKERNRTGQRLHNTAKKVADMGCGVIMEDIKGIRKLYRRGNGQGKRFRGKMNTWSYYELQRLIDYKCRWNELPVKYVKAHGTSSKCAVCGRKVIPEEHRMMYCPKCNVHVDRDVNASRNILARGSRFEPDGLQNEAMNQLKDGESIAVSEIWVTG